MQFIYYSIQTSHECINVRHIFSQKLFFCQNKVLLLLRDVPILHFHNHYHGKENHCSNAKGIELKSLDMDICGTTYLYYMFVIEQVPQPFPLFRIALEQMESYYYL